MAQAGIIVSGWPALSGHTILEADAVSCGAEIVAEGTAHVGMG